MRCQDCINIYDFSCSNSIYLKDGNNNFVLNLKNPQKISASKGLNLSDKNSSKALLRYADDEYHIAPNSIKATDKIGDFTLGAIYGNEVDNIAMLETETGLFTKYEKSRFAISSSVKKSLNTTYAKDYNTISITPEFKLNNYNSFNSNVKFYFIFRFNAANSLYLSLYSVFSEILSASFI